MDLQPRTTLFWQIKVLSLNKVLHKQTYEHNNDHKRVPKSNGIYNKL